MILTGVLGAVLGACAVLLLARRVLSHGVYKFKLPPDADCHGIIVVVARSVEHAREVAAAYAQSDEAKALNGGSALWSRWFREHAPTVYPVDRPGVVTWTEFLRGC